MDEWLRKITRKLAFLSEAGRVLSSKNEARIKSASDELSAVLAELGTSETDVAEAERSYQKRMQVLDDAVRTRFRTPTTYCFTVDVFDTSLVYCLTQRTADGSYYGDGLRTLYQVDYAITDDDSVTFGTSAEVVARTVYEPISPLEMAESLITGDTIPLIEKAIRDDGTTTVKVISPGWGSSGYYPADVLERDGPTVFPAGTHMYIDHPTERERRELPERSTARLAAVTTSPATWQASGPAGPGLYAETRVKSSQRQDLNDIADHIGVSIIASGTYELGEADGKKGKIIRSLTSGESIDFVTRPGAGGKIVSMMESRRGTLPAPVSIVEESAMTEVEAQALRESNRKLTEDMARLHERDLLREGRAVVVGALAGHKDLHALTRARLEESLAARVVMVDGAVDVAATKALVEAAVTAEREYLGAMAPTGVIRGVGAVAESATAEQTEVSLNDSFRRLGMSESAATIAAKGR